MATRKTSETGAYMSQYDKEVEVRLKKLEEQSHTKPTGTTQSKNDERLSALEAEIVSLKAQLEEKNSSPSVSDGGIEDKFNELVRVLKMNKTLNISKLSKGLF
jgi:replicative DNA helicase